MNRSNKTYRIVGRGFTFKNQRGEVVQTVEPNSREGMGVVGFTPVLLPGEQFLYGSGAKFETPSGSIEGFYQVIEDRIRSEAFEALSLRERFLFFSTLIQASEKDKTRGLTSNSALQKGFNMRGSQPNVKELAVINGADPDVSAANAAPTLGPHERASASTPVDQHKSDFSIQKNLGDEAAAHDRESKWEKSIREEKNIPRDIFELRLPPTGFNMEVHSFDMSLLRETDNQ